MTASVLRFNTNIATGTLDAVSNADVTGNAVFMGSSFRKIESLSAYLIVTAATSSLTVTPKWQVSNDNTTYVDCSEDVLNSAVLPIATGAENVTEAIPAPEVVYGYRYSRLMLSVAGATGAAGDLYSIGYSYRKNYG